MTTDEKIKNTYREAADSDLINMINNPFNYSGQAIEYAKKEAEHRGIDFIQHQKILPIEKKSFDNQQPYEIPASVKALKAFAFLDLIASIIISIYIFANSTIEISYSEKITNPIAIGLGLGILIQGIMVCTLFFVIANIAENIIVIKQNSNKK